MKSSPPSTEDYDHGKKFFYNRSIPSFVEYLLIAQDRVRVEHYIKQSDGGWLMQETTDPEAIITFDSVAVQFKLSECYRRVEF